MNILHFSLGFPPYRTGGLTKFCMDLMIEQAADGHEVALIWPGRMNFIKKYISIKDRGIEIYHNQKIKSFEIINPLPISYDEGINQFKEFTQEGDISVYSSFLDKTKPDVIHIHTLMGVHKNFIVAAKKRKIRLVYSAHDFFPICPKVTMFHNGKVCDTVNTCCDCSKCNTTSLSLKKIKMLQSPLYRHIKESFLVKKLRKRHRDNFLGETSVQDNGIIVGNYRDYINLRNHYYSLLSLMDIIHYNSSVTKKVYESEFELEKNITIGITHSNVSNCKKIRNYTSNVLRITFLGPQSRAKGYFLLKNTLDKLRKSGKEFTLNIFFKPTKLEKYMNVHDRYSYEQLENIFEETDLLVVPSIWYETFGYTVLEALSFGVPVVISDNVGAKDILRKKCGLIIENINEEKLYNVLNRISNLDLKTMNEFIVNEQRILTINQMSKEIENKCYLHY